MEEINILINNNIVVILGIMFLLIIVLLMMLMMFKNKMIQLQWKYDFFTKGTTMDLDDVLTNTLEELRATQKKVAELEEKQLDLRKRLKSCIQNLRVVRYNAFDNTGSDLSYSIALTDEENNGVIISSIYGREDNRSYAKPVIEGKSQYVLSTEEIKALQQH